MSESGVVVTVANHILEIELARPEKKNALTAAMYAAMADALLRADADPQVTAVLIYGNANFTSGNDLTDFVRSPPAGDDSPVFRFLNAIATARKPLIAAVRGYATGVGTTMLLHCDFVIAGESARFHTPFVDIGLVPEAGSSLLLPMTIGTRRAASMVLLGEPLDARAAVACDLVTECVPDDQALPRARAIGAALVAKPAGALLATKALMKAALAPALAAQMAREGEAFTHALRMPEAAEAMRAFLEKRAPRFPVEEPIAVR